jgi:WD40 repeat protein
MCPNCLLELAFDVTSLETEQLDRGDAPTVVMPGETFAAGQIQGERYRIRSLLGRGGMGEVWRAYDLKLRQDVALKALRIEQMGDAGALEMLRQEVRVAREVISPNVCRVFDLQEVDGQELVSMEFIDGTTLAEILEERSPLDLDEAREIASQFLAGLEAVHDAGLVHRDIKPENIMLTRTGRVVVMDFGIAKALQEGKGSFAGTPAYMSPEQSRAGELDARSDVFSAGVVLAEMVDPGGVRSRDDRSRVLEGVHQETPALAETPWAGVVRQAVAAEPEARFDSAAALARALEEVTLRAAGEEEGNPYPGLASFTREQAKFFFGRELEVEALWKRLRRPHLLALIAPSGAGKSSFLSAGLLPALPDDWDTVVVTPGNRPLVALERALVEAIGPGRKPVHEQREGGSSTIVSLASDWRRGHEQCLLIVDQFEELFTQNPESVRDEFAELLARLPLEADTFVLLSMREDFLYHCQPYEALAPVFSELMPLGNLGGSSLRRALVQPALKCGYRFEDEALVDEMVEEVGREHGALPLLAFAASRLWSLRDRETGRITREACERIGGVGGALAQHAEATLEAIGRDRLPLVRELFRNLVTAEGTRATWDRQDLLSVFGDEERVAAAKVLDSLVSARLLTTYEVPAADGDETAGYRIEIIHESLLSAWPRLVRWRAQDADSVRMRDQLRSAARLWVDRGKPDDLLWSGTTFREYELWRERYRVGISATEREFVRAMTARAERQKRRRRIALTSAFAVLLVVLGVMATLWWQGELARREAVAEARRAEASKLLALGQLESADNLTAALAYAIASLELEDTASTRRFALETLWRGPTAFVASPEWTWNAEFSPDGEWLAAGGQEERLDLWPRGGGEPRRLEGRRSVPLSFSNDSRLLVTKQQRLENSLRVWSVADGRLLSTRQIETAADTWMGYFRRSDESIVTLIVPPEWDHIAWEEWPLLEGDGHPIGRSEIFYWVTDCEDPSGEWLGWVTQHEVFLMPLAKPGVEETRLLGRSEANFTGCAIDSDRGVMASLDESGQVWMWGLDSPSGETLRRLGAGEAVGGRELGFSPDGRRLVAGNYDQITRIWDLEGPPDAAPERLHRGEVDFVLDLSFHPAGDWLVTAETVGTVLWPVTDQRSYRLIGHTAAVSDLEFTPDGSWLISSSYDRTARRWPLDRAVAERSEEAFRHGAMLEQIELSPSAELLAWSSSGDGPYVSSMTGETVSVAGMVFNPFDLAWDETGRWLASCGGYSQQQDAMVRIWDLAEFETQATVDGPPTQLDPSVILDAEDGKGVSSVAFLPEGELLAGGETGLRRWSIEDGTFEQLTQGEIGRFTLMPDSRSVLLRVGGRGLGGGSVSVYDLEAGSSRDIPTHGDRAIAIAMDPTGEILVSGDEEGVVRVSRLDGGEPHLLLGHTGSVQAVAVSPDGQWIASGSADNEIRLWPMPDLDRQPLQTLPYEELLAKLRTLTNLRVVRDTASETGWKLEIGPFPGWAEVPTW